jgi:hypothetical protein
LDNRRAEQVLPGGVGTNGSREEVRKRRGEVNIVQIMCTHQCKWKNDTIETIPRIGGDKEWWRG